MLTPADQRDRQDAYRRQRISDASDLSVARNVAVFATVTDDAIDQFCQLPKSWKAAFTADPAYPVSPAQIERVRGSGHGVFAWSDCSSTPATACVAFAAGRGLDGWYGQAESADQFDNATSEPRAPVALVGNLSALRPDQLVLVAAGAVLFIQETYYNVQPDLKPDWRGANNGVGGNCWACYASDSEGAVYTPVDGRFNKATDSVYAEGMLQADWKAIA